MKQNIEINNTSVGMDLAFSKSEERIVNSDKCRCYTSDVVAGPVSARGITLIALVITIIVLLILAGVALTLTIGENGIINNAKYAKKKTENAQIEENTTLKYYENFIDNYVSDNNTSTKKVSAEMISFTPQNPNWNVENLQEALDYLYNN